MFLLPLLKIIFTIVFITYFFTQAVLPVFVPGMKFFWLHQKEKKVDGYSSSSVFKEATDLIKEADSKNKQAKEQSKQEQKEARETLKRAEKVQNQAEEKAKRLKEI